MTKMLIDIGRSWFGDIVAEKRWASPQCVAELRSIIAAIERQAA
jgi:hypothetical protein